MNMEDNMNKKEFISVMQELWGSDIDIGEAWDTYGETCVAIDDNDLEAIRALEGIAILDHEERLRWRMLMAEKGIEMTPIQVDQYVSIIELALGI
tara:strand:- start:36 stop:320 length:285 start_codon:yes stop_codon:yes gene_type:complete